MPPLLCWPCRQPRRPPPARRSGSRNSWIWPRSTRAAVRWVRGTRTTPPRPWSSSRDRLDELQEALYAEGTGGGRRSLLLVLQGMDTSGKGGVIRHVAGLVNPQGLQIASFKRPTPEELAHDFLWRIRKQLPVPGRIGVFDRSHYEDVLVVRVDGLVPGAGLAGALPDDPRLRGRALGAGHHRRQVHAAHLPAGAGRAAAGPARRAGQAAGSTTPATSTPGPSGRRTSRPTPTRCARPTPTPRPGT